MQSKGSYNLREFAGRLSQRGIHKRLCSAAAMSFVMQHVGCFIFATLLCDKQVQPGVWFSNANRTFCAAATAVLYSVQLQCGVLFLQ
jgi:hypothetical protein